MFCDSLSQKGKIVHIPILSKRRKRRELKEAAGTAAANLVAAEVWMANIEDAGRNFAKIRAVGDPPNGGRIASAQADKRMRLAQTLELYETACFDAFLQETEGLIEALKKPAGPDRKELILDFLTIAGKFTYSYADRALRLDGDERTTRWQLKEELQHLVDTETGEAARQTRKRAKQYKDLGIYVPREPSL